MKTILVVDDMAVFREPIAASLRLAGYQTLCAADGQEALVITREQRPDLILLDVAMKNMDGLTFLNRLRADSEFGKTPVILLSAISEKNQIMAAASFGVRDYLLKSRFRLADLLERVKRWDLAPEFPPAAARCDPASRARSDCVEAILRGASDARGSDAVALNPTSRRTQRCAATADPRTIP